jgi:hypothetical protein
VPPECGSIVQPVKVSRLLKGLVLPMEPAKFMAISWWPQFREPGSAKNIDSAANGLLNRARSPEAASDAR